MSLTESGPGVEEALCMYVLHTIPKMVLVVFGTRLFFLFSAWTGVVAGKRSCAWLAACHDWTEFGLRLMATLTMDRFDSFVPLSAGGMATGWRQAVEEYEMTCSKI